MTTLLPVEFSRLISLEDLGDQTALTMEATPDELTALSLRMRLEVLALKGRVVVSLARDGVSHKVEGSFTARVVQICSIALDPFEQTMEDTFVMYFSPENHPKVAHMDVEDQEFYTDPQVDVGEVMVQYVCLSLEDFPICPDHQVHEGGRAGADIPLAQVEKKNPFEILQALIKKENGS